MSKKPGLFSAISLISCAVLLFAATNIYYPKWQNTQTEATISWDVTGYYLYLPAIFIYGDATQLEFMQDILDEYQPSPHMDQAFKHESGNYIFKYSAGMALAYSPAFFAAWLFASLTDYPADGFSRPFQFALSQWSLLIAFLGLFYLRRFLRLFFSDLSVGLSLVAIVFGSNYLSYASTNGAMTHNYLFTIYALLLWNTHLFYLKPTMVRAVAIGLLCGFATIIRPTELITVLIPLLWGLHLPLTHFLKDRGAFLLKNSLKICAAVLGFLIIGSLQLIYWKTMSGDWLVYTYEDQGFSWLQPKIWKGFFSSRAGWLLYSPMMALALVGLFFLRKQQRKLFGLCLLMAVLIIYITFSWDIWWYGGSLGQRALVQSYAIFSIPMAAFFTVVGRKRYRQWIFLPVLMFFSLYNIYWFHQSHRGGLFAAEQMNSSYFWSVLGRFSVDEDTIKLLDTNDKVHREFDNPRLVLLHDFDEMTTVDCQMAPIDGSGSLCLPPGETQSPVFFVDGVPAAGELAVRTSALFQIKDKEWDYWKQSLFVVHFFNDEDIIRSRQIRIQRFLNPGQMRELYFDINVPHRNFNRVGVQIVNPGSAHPLIVDNLKVYYF